MPGSRTGSSRRAFDPGAGTGPAGSGGIHRRRIRSLGADREEARHAALASGTVARDRDSECHDTYTPAQVERIFGFSSGECRWRRQCAGLPQANHQGGGSVRSGGRNRYRRSRRVRSHRADRRPDHRHRQPPRRRRHHRGRAGRRTRRRMAIRWSWPIRPARCRRTSRSIPTSSIIRSATSRRSRSSAPPAPSSWSTMTCR